MDTVWKLLLGIGIGLLVVWLALIVALLAAGRRYERPLACYAAAVRRLPTWCGRQSTQRWLTRAVRATPG
jgi:hypothetical protein